MKTIVLEEKMIWALRQRNARCGFALRLKWVPPAAPRETKPEEPVLKMERNPSSFVSSSMVWIGAEYTPTLQFFVARRQTDEELQNGIWQHIAS